MNVTSEGDIGDIIYLCGILSEIGGKHNLLLHTSQVTSLRDIEAVKRVHALLEPLLAKQPYINEFRIFEAGDKIDWSSGGFRAGGFHFHETSLFRAHLNHLKSMTGIGDSIKGKNKWIHLDEQEKNDQLIVINLTHRYRNPYFPWKEIVDHYRDRLVFIGLPHEHRDFINSYGDVEYRETKDFLEIAKLIDESALFIGNQSSAFAVCEGLKHDCIQETSLFIPDCIWKRPNAQHVFDGECVLPDIYGSGELRLESKVKEVFSRKTHITPPGGWKFRGISTTAFGPMVNAVKLNYGAEFPDDKSAEDAILEEQFKRLPDFFRDDSTRHLFDIVKRTYANAD